MCGFITTNNVKLNKQKNDHYIGYWDSIKGYYPYYNVPFMMNQCGKINISTMDTNKLSFFQTNSGNSCFNGHLFFDLKGNVGVCPFLKTSLHYLDLNFNKGTIANQEVVNLWNISKDNISECNICEYRNVCSDCRVNTIDDKLFSKPKYCNYDPYNGK